MVALLEKIAKTFAARSDAQLGSRIEELRAPLAEIERRFALHGSRESAHRGVEATRQLAARELRATLGELYNAVGHGGEVGLVNPALSRAAACAVIAGESLPDVWVEVVSGEPLVGYERYPFETDAEFTTERDRLRGELAELEAEVARRSLEREEEARTAELAAKRSALETQAAAGPGPATPPLVRRDLIERQKDSARSAAERRRQSGEGSA